MSHVTSFRWVNDRAAAPMFRARARLSDAAASCRRRSLARPHWVIRRSDSVATPGVILESPRSLSTNSIGTSRTRSPGPDRAERQVGLEDVAHRGDAVEVDLLQRRTTEQPVAGGRVVHGHAEQQPGVEVAAAGEEMTAQRPVGDAPPRTQREPITRSASKCGEQLGQRSGRCEPSASISPITS